MIPDESPGKNARQYEAMAAGYAADNAGSPYNDYERPATIALLGNVDGDWRLHAPENYFAVKQVTETWIKDSSQFEVSFWRRPLTAMCEAIASAGFVIECLAEPAPQPELARRDPGRVLDDQHAATVPVLPVAEPDVNSHMRVRFELFVDDYDRTIGFYTQALGFSVARREASYVSLRHGDVTIGLGLIANLPADSAGPGFTQRRVRREQGAGVEIVLETEDLDGLYERVLASGFPLAEPMTSQPWGLRDFRITDPDGYYLRLTELG
jgi:lactoylglutathione lyase